MRSASLLLITGTLRTPWASQLTPPFWVNETVSCVEPEKYFRSGCLLMNLIVPPSELAPYSVPCGPRRISASCRSKKRGSAVPWLYRLRVVSDTSSR